MNILTSYFLHQISSLSKSCYSHIRQLRCIRPYLNSKTASTIAASTVHSKLDYWNSLSTTIFLNLKLIASSAPTDSELSCTHFG